MAQQVTDYYKYCPGEQTILISDAICFGRRMSSYPKCPGCQFNDDEIAARKSQASKTEAQTQMIEKVFKAYDVRAIYPDPLNEEIAWRIGNATAQFLRTSLRGLERTEPNAGAIVIGRDMRKSGPALADAFIKGARSEGTRIIDIGMIDTSQIYFAVNHFGATGGVQVTASHNPAQYNGFKICGRQGRPVGSDTGLMEICRIAQSVRVREKVDGGELVEEDLAEPYKAFIRKFLKGDRSLRIVVDASNGMAGKWFPILFEDCDNLEVIPMNFEHKGEFSHDPNPLVDANLRWLQEEVLQSEADFGVCFDGDADRCVLVDEKAQIVRCDYLTGLLAVNFLRDHPNSTIVYDLRSSKILPEEIRRAGGVPKRERVGHVFMKKSLLDSKGIFGGELSGHFYFADNWYCDSGMLAFVHVVNILSQTSESISELIAPFQRYAGSGEINFKNEQKDETIQTLSKKYADAQVDYLDGITVQYADWWFNVRKSNTEPLLRLNLEADSESLMNEKIDEVAKLLGQRVEH